jgi:hypothetical protein
MGNLFLSFTIAIAGAIGLAVLSRAFDLEFYTNKILPLIPILYAIIYEVLEHKKANKARARAKTFPPSLDRIERFESDAATGPGLSFGRVVTDVGVSFGAKFSVEMFLVALFLRFSGQSFHETYGAFSIETMGRFLRGEHPWLTGNDGVYLLALIALITCFITGLWIGYTSKGTAILEGVLAGAAVTVVMSMTSMLILYRKIEAVTEQLADSMGYVMRAGFLVVIMLQVLLYGLWSGLVQMGKKDRAAGSADRKVSKKAKR